MNRAGARIVAGVVAWMEVHPLEAITPARRNPFSLAPVDATVRPRTPTTAVACIPRNCVARPAIDWAATRP